MELIKTRFSKPITSILLLIICITVFIACRKEKVEEPYKPKNAYSAYKLSIQQANLHNTALGRDWLDAADKALDSPIEIETPFEEVFYVDPSKAFGIAYIFETLRGQRIEVDLSIEAIDSTLLFMELYRINKNSGQKVKVASAKKDSSFLKFEPRKDNKYILLLQPELLRGGRFRLTIKNIATLVFPVTGQDKNSIGSNFGEPREGGRRKHHGVDIFAARHTEVIACSDGYITNVGTSDLGGNIIWLYDSKRMLNIYYAHLQTQDVKINTRIKPGQVIGTVGNTGNARTTPPHLHFGLYHRIDGPIDPINFLIKTNEIPPEIKSDLSYIGQWVRSKNSSLSCLSSKGLKLPLAEQLEKNSLMKVEGAAGHLYRVNLPDGTISYIKSGNIEPIDIVDRIKTDISLPFLNNPDENGIQIHEIHQGDSLKIYGYFRNYIYASTMNGIRGWIINKELHERSE